MANIRLRSPYTITKTLAGDYSHATMQLQVDGVSRYTITKDALTSGVGQATAMFEISQLVRDYLNITFGDDVVTNGDFSKFGSDVILNGSFANGETNWTKTGDASIGGGVATFTNTDESTSIKQSNAMVIGKYYTLTYEVKTQSSGGLRTVRFNQNADNVDLPSTVGVHSVSGEAFQPDLVLKKNGDPTTLSFTNISLKEIDSWEVTNDVTIANGVATFYDAFSSELRQKDVFIDREFYEVTYEVTSYTSGKIGFYQITNEGILEYNEAPSTVGVHTIRGTAYGNDLIIRPSVSGTVLSLTNISINTGYVGRTNSTNYVDITAVVTTFNNAGGQIDVTSFVNVGFDGYSEFTEGYNFEIPQEGLGQTNTTIYALESEAGSIPYFDNANLLRYESFSKFATSKTVSGVTVTIKRICEPKFTPIRITFVNKFGALQDLWFDKKNVESLSVKRDNYKRSLSSSIDGSYSVHRHANKILDVIGNEAMTMNTGFVDEGMNEVIKELMLSEQCWALIEGKILPMTPTETKKTYKTSLNDNLINHTVKFKYAFDLINNIR